MVRSRNANGLTGVVVLMALLMAVGGVSPVAGQDAPGLKKIGVAEVKIAPMLIESTKDDGREKVQSLGRVAEAMGDQVIDRLHNSRKFEVYARSDLDTLLTEDGQDRGLGSGEGGFQSEKLDYLLVLSFNDFADIKETASFGGIGKTASKRLIRVGAVAKIFDASTGRTIETANLQFNTSDKGMDRAHVQADGDERDELLIQAAQALADKAANRVVDVVFPAMIIGLTGKQVTINRGDGTGIEKDQVWDVFALGDEMIDPSTGQSLGSEEVQVGQVKVTAITPKFSRAVIVGEDLGIDKLQILRRAGDTEVAAVE